MLRAAALFALLAVLWAPDAVLGDGVWWVHDLRTHHLPWRAWAASEWRAGRVPLWAPGVANGYPLMADGQTGALYPPTMLLFVLLPPGEAMNAAILLHHWWAALGAFALARALGRSERAALLAGVAWGFGGLAATHVLYLGFQNAMAWLPWLLAAVVAGSPAGAALAAAMMLVAGHPQAAAFGLLLAGVVALWRAAAERPRARARLGGFAIAMLAAFLLAAPQLAATLELVRFSMRDGGVGADFAGIGSLPPWELVNAVLPAFFGLDRPGDVPQTYHHRAGDYWGSGENHWEMAFYLGIPAVVLALVAARRQRFWSGVAVAAVLLMLGRYLPFWPVLRHLPGLGGFRFPVRFSLWLCTAVAVLAAAGLDRVLAADAAARRRWARAAALAGLAALLALGAAHAAIALDEPALRARLEAHYRAKTRLPPPPEDLPPLQRAALPGAEPLAPEEVPAKVDHVVASLEASTAPWSPRVLVPAASLAGSVLAVLRGGPVGAWALLGLLYADLRSFGADYVARVPAAMLREEPRALRAIRAAGGPGRGRVTVVDRRQHPSLDVDLMSASLGLLWGTRDVIVTSPLLLVRNEAVLSLVGLDVGDRGPQKVDRLAAHPALVDLLGVRWLLGVHDLSRAGYRELDLGGGPVRLFENPDALVGAWLVGCARAPADPWAALQRLKDPRAEAIVEGADPGRLPPCRPGPAGVARIVRESPVEIAIEVEADRQALLVQNDTWYPGWRAELDGEGAPLLLADFLFRGVVVGPGRHEVVLRYRPSWWRPSLAAVAAGLVILLALALSGRRRSPWTPSTSSPSAS